MKHFVFIIIALTEVLLMSSCQESLTVDKNHKVHYIMTNDTDTPVSITSYHSENKNNLVINSNDKYEYWQEIMSGTIEADKVALFSSDSLDINYGDAGFKRIYAERHLTDANQKSLEMMWVNSSDDNTLVFSIKENI